MADIHFPHKKHTDIECYKPKVDIMALNVTSSEANNDIKWVSVMYCLKLV